MTDRFPQDPAHARQRGGGTVDLRDRSEPRAGDLPSRFVVEAAAALLLEVPASRCALDVAMGSGRHALPLARMGWRVFGVDSNVDALGRAGKCARDEGIRIRAWCADLTRTELPADAFDLVVVTRYLQRNLFASIRRAVAPGGFVVYETFTTAQRALGRGPTSPDHLLEPGELRKQFESFDLKSYEEVDGPDAVARLVARRVG